MFIFNPSLNDVAPLSPISFIGTSRIPNVSPDDIRIAYKSELLMSVFEVSSVFYLHHQ